ncbi:hypothetical protein [Pseudomonas sp. AK106]
MPESPYITHRDIFLTGMYGTAYLLQDFILYQYNPRKFFSDIDQRCGGFDRRHQQIYEDLKAWFSDHGAASPGFRQIAEHLQSQRIARAQSVFEELCRLREMFPADYPSEPGANPSEEHGNALRNHEWYHEQNVSKGYISR